MTDLSARLRNITITIAAVILGVGLYLATQFQGHHVTLKTVAEQAVPLDVALANDQPTVLEFYADWCSSCRAMAPMVADLETEFAGKVNFVMLNVDNSKWMPELSQYHVNGIPHFEFLTPDGVSVGQAIGEQPKPILTQNLLALKADQSLLDTQVGQTSTVRGPKGDEAQPRSHG